MPSKLAKIIGQRNVIRVSAGSIIHHTYLLLLLYFYYGI